MGTPLNLTAEQLEQHRENSRRGGIKSQSLEQQALRIVQHWPELTQLQKDVIRGMLRPVISEKAAG